MQVMKHLQSNIKSMNGKYAENQLQERISKPPIENDSRSRKMFDRELINESDLENEVYRLQNTLRQMTMDFEGQRREVDDACTEQSRKIQQDADQTHRLQRDLERGYRKSFFLSKTSGLSCFRICQLIE